MKLPGSVKSLFEIYRGLQRGIYILFFARIINSAGSFVYPFLALFLTDKLGYSTGDTGLILMLASVSFVPGSLLGGKLSDRYGRKKILAASQFFSAAIFLICAFIPDKKMIPFFILGAEFFLGIFYPASTAMVIDLSTPEQRKGAFSLIYLGHNLGFAVGPLLAGFLYNSHPNWLFSGDAVTTLVSIILIILFIAESKPLDQEISKSLESSQSEQDSAQENSRDLEKAEAGSVFSVLARRPELVAFFLIMIIIDFVYAQMSFSLPLFMDEVFGSRGAVLYGSAMTFNAVTVIIGTTIIIGLTRNMKPIIATILAAVFYAAGFGGIYWGMEYSIILIAVFIWTTGEILGATNIDVYISNHTPMSHRARINSVAPIVIGVGYATSPFIMGKFIEYNSLRMVWPLCGILSIAAAAGLTILYIMEKRKSG